MKLKMTTNLGTEDARRLGLDPEECTEGATIDAKQPAADELLKRGWASEAKPSEPKPLLKGPA